MSINANAKGKRGEREFSRWLRTRGVNAQRGVQYQGSVDSPDVVSTLPFHIEVKRVEKLNLIKAMQQAIQDSGDKTPLVAHRTNKNPWLITMLAEDWLAAVNVNAE